mmetsp:Transcript_16528/g.40917  ORF Transcript_16528/g.40917 Transcript_16528/m.40917 type:complete len:408 (+) Transcript_16528:1761-2984(+)
MYGGPAAGGISPPEYVMAQGQMLKRAAAGVHTQAGTATAGAGGPTAKQASNTASNSRKAPAASPAPTNHQRIGKTILIEADLVDPGITLLELYRRSEKDTQLLDLIHHHVLDNLLLSSLPDKVVHNTDAVYVCLMAACVVSADVRLLENLHGIYFLGGPRPMSRAKLTFGYASETYREWPIPVLLCRFSRDWVKIRECLGFLRTVDSVVTVSREREQQETTVAGMSLPLLGHHEQDHGTPFLDLVTPRGETCAQQLLDQQAGAHQQLRWRANLQRAPDGTSDDGGILRLLCKSGTAKGTPEDGASASPIEDSGNEGTGEAAVLGSIHEQHRLFSAADKVAKLSVNEIESLLNRGMELEASDFHVAMRHGRFDLLEFFKERLVLVENDEPRYRECMRICHAKMKQIKM